MAALKTIYLCSNCGASSPKWLGRCPECSEWNTLIEEIVEKKASDNKAFLSGNFAIKTVSLSEVEADNHIRIKTGIGEFDRVLGGGLVKGSAVLLGGEPGAGKSTIVLQACKSLSEKHRVLYISGEESLSQIKLRAVRLSVNSDNIKLANETNVDVISNEITTEKTDIVIIDSIQTMVTDEVSSSAGSVTQVRESATRLIKAAKASGIPMIIIGHINKDGAIAGPKVLEHIVDTVLYFEGDKYLSFRILRAVKNRFGSTNEIGIFEMSSKGLIEIENPSMVLLDKRTFETSGCCVTGIMEGTRPLLAEIQSLVAKSSFSTPRRTASGVDYNRTNLMLAVLEKRAGYFLSALDVYVNVTGGLDISEPSADIAIALSIVSSLIDRPIPNNLVAFGEIGLGGEIRAVSNSSVRINEAIRLGFEKVVISKNEAEKLSKEFNQKIEIIGISSVTDIKSIFQ